jgi:thiamine transport system substrate-binding protein
MTAVSVIAACSSSSSGPQTITLVAYDSFPKSGTSLNDALATFTKNSGITVNIVTAGDTGTMVQKAVLTSGNPEGDVMWGVDNTLLTAATDGKIFASDPIDVDFGDVCVNYDIKWFKDHGINPPQTLDDLIGANYKNLLVVENPTTSSPGLAFLLSTIAKYGDANVRAKDSTSSNGTTNAGAATNGINSWQDYWKSLRANGVEVVDSWDIAYTEKFSGAAGSKGDKPLVVSYGSSPPAEVVFADPPIDTAPTGVSAATCFRQIEYAGILRGSKHLGAARKLMDFLVSSEFQKELPLNLFVYPADKTVKLPDVFKKWAVVPDAPFLVSPDDIKKNRQQWQEQWTQIVLR